MSLDPATVRRIAKLARIRVEEGQLSQLQAELNGILGWIEQLNEVNVGRHRAADRRRPEWRCGCATTGVTDGASRAGAGQRARPGRRFLCGAEGGGVMVSLTLSGAARPCGGANFRPAN